MNDSGDKIDPSSGDAKGLRDKVLLQGSLENGQSYDVAVTVMEEDGANSQAAQEHLASELQKTGNPIAVAGGEVIKIASKYVQVDDSDDVPGAVGVLITNKNGRIVANYRTVDRIYEHKTEGVQGHDFGMNGDGSTYGLYLTVR